MHKKAILTAVNGAIWSSALAAVLVACSSSSGAPSGSSVAPLDPLFTDPAVPRCDGSTLYKVTGQLEGQTLNVADFLLSNLDPNDFQILEVANGAVRTDLGLSWTAPLRENVAIPVTGGTFRVPDNQPLGGKTICVTAGKFGSPTPDPDAGGGRQLLFQITAGRDGTCNGPAIAVALNGCDWRSPSASFPAAPPMDAGAE
jgi:hypothetical protein